jgi:uncharacterized membrane protein YeaQ/YmgE (transglycosylase-associated protein family)
MIRTEFTHAPKARPAMLILSNIVLGLIVGFLARGILPGEQKMGWILTCVLGIAGSVLAQVAGQAMGWYAVGEPSGWIASVLGALALLYTVNLLRNSKSS